MEKIGIITLHFYENFGSVLQAYALLKKVEALFPEREVAILNYIPDGVRYKYFNDEELQGKYEKKRELFDRFREDVLKISDKVLSSDDLNRLGSFDYLITGSDQVWNPAITYLDPAYFLNFAQKKCVKISYAASLAVGSAHPQLRKSIFKKHLPTFDFISIREKVDQAFVQSFADTTVETVLDPTMLLTQNDYLPIIENRQNSTDKFIMLYFLTHDPNAIDIANMMGQRYNCKLIHYFADMPDRLFYGSSGNFAFAGPQEFLWYINNAEMIFTNSFHGTVFSILFEKPFYTYTAKREMLSRIFYLTEMLGLEDRRLNGYLAPEKFNLNVDYDSVSIRLQEQRSKSISFLSKALDYQK